MLVTLVSVGFAAVPLHVTILDPAGRPIPAATVVFAGEGDFHHVNTVDGSWTGDALYTNDGELELNEGGWLKITANAPGFWSTGLQYELKATNNTLTFTLFPMRVDADDRHTALQRDRTLAFRDGWAAALTDPGGSDSETERRRLGFAAREWAEAALAIGANADFAMALCRSAGHRGCPLR